MGRPPDCDCHCGVSPPTDCEFTDAFGSTGTGYTTYELAMSSELPVFNVSGGKLVLSNGTPVASGTYYRTVSLPSSGLKTLSVQAKVYGSGTQRVGLFIGNTYAYFGRFSGSNCGVRDCDSVGETNSDAETTFSSGLASGDTLKMQLQEVSTGVFDTLCYKNGTLVNSQLAEAHSVTDTVNVGVYSELGGEWDDLAIACDDLPDDTCVVCTSVASVWTLTAANIQNSSCNQCTLLNRTTNLYFRCAGSTECHWQSAESLNCNSSTRPLWIMRVLAVPSSGVYAILMSGLRSRADVDGICSGGQGNTATATYRLLSPFNCLSDNVFIHISNLGGCTNFPPTITVSPA